MLKYAAIALSIFRMRVKALTSLKKSKVQFYIYINKYFNILPSTILYSQLNLRNCTVYQKIGNLEEI
ncbi:MAG: HKD family nuclease [Bacillariaceae sp.]|jgi:HKD family nuclease